MPVERTGVYKRREHGHWLLAESLPEKIPGIVYYSPQ